MPAELKTLRIPTGQIEENCYFLWREGSSQALIFDPGADAPDLLTSLKSRDLLPAAFVLTHCHYDHIGALTELKAAFPAAPIYCPEDEQDWHNRPTLNLSFFTGANVKCPPPDVLVKDGAELELAGIKLKALHCPGHSPGGTAYYVALEKDQPGTPLLFCGDIIFKQGIGRTDFPGGSEPLLIAGIQEKIFTLPEATVIFPGHGPRTTVQDERALNPFCR